MPVRVCVSEPLVTKGKMSPCLGEVRGWRHYSMPGGKERENCDRRQEVSHLYSCLTMPPNDLLAKLAKLCEGSTQLCKCYFGGFCVFYFSAMSQGFQIRGFWRPNVVCRLCDYESSQSNTPGIR